MNSFGWDENFIDVVASSLVNSGSVATSFFRRSIHFEGTSLTEHKSQADRRDHVIARSAYQRFQTVNVRFAWIG